MTKVTKKVRQTRLRKSLLLICTKYNVTLADETLSLDISEELEQYQMEQANLRIDRYLSNHPELLLV